MKTDEQSVPGQKKNHFRPEIIILAMLALFAFSLFRVDPYVASNLSITPDSEEYAIAASHIVSDHSYFITVDGKKLPPRYPPWFSLLFLAPGYLIFGNEIGNAIYPVTFLAILGVLMAFLIGQRISGIWGGLLSGVALAVFPLYRAYAGEIMTEIPSSALVLAACWIYMRIASSESSKRYLFLLAGITCGLCGAIRPVLMSTIIPFLLLCLTHAQKEGRIIKLANLSIPSAVLICATLAYNSTVFGSPFRNGYNYWCAVPFDYSSLCFSTSYLALNCKALFLSPFSSLVSAGLLIYLLNKRFPQIAPTKPGNDSALRRLAEFTVVSSLPVMAVHLLYFFQTSRFYIPAMCLLVVIAVSMAGKWFENIPSTFAVVLLGVLTTAAVIMAFNAPPLKPSCRILVDQLADNTASNAIIISSIDPVYLEHFVKKSTQRRIIPLSRNVEYASKVICPDRVDNPSPFPASCFDHRCKGLLNGGAKEAVAITADEGIDMLTKELRKGIPVVLEASLVITNDIRVISLLQERFSVISRGGCFYQLGLK